MTDPCAKIQKSIDGVAAAVRALERTSAKSVHRPERYAGRIVVDVDALTSEEIGELRTLLEHEGQVAEWSSRRLDAGGPKLDGMYAEFSRLGLATQAMGGHLVALSPMAHWAVEKSDQRARDAEAARRAQWAHDARVSVVSSLMGIGGTILGVVLGWLLGSL